MGCGSSSTTAVSPETSNGHPKMTEPRVNGLTHDSHEYEDLPTVILPDTPAKNKKPPPIAFEIPLEDFDGTRRTTSTPPPHLQRLLHTQPTDIRRTNIDEKLHEADIRRQQILQQRAASAQRRTQRMVKAFQKIGRVDSAEPSNLEPETKKVTNSVILPMPPGPGTCEDKNI